MSSKQSTLNSPSVERRLVNLDILRGVAALMVCLSHAPYFLGQAGKGMSFDVSWLAIPALGVGVDLFFAISGFVVAMSLCDLHARSGSFGRATCAFYVRRLGRIVALAWLTLIVLGFVAITLPRETIPWADLVSAATFTANGHFGQCFKGAAGCGSANLLQHSWSLALELQFYLLAPVLFLIPVRILRGITLLVFIIGIFFLRPWQTSLAWAFRIEALLLGFWIGREWITPHDWRWPHHVPALTWVELFGLLILMALLPRIMTGPLSGAAIVCVAAIAGWIVVRSALSPAPLSNKITVRIGTSLGSWSYAIYLVHPPIMIAIGWSGMPWLIGFGRTLALSMMMIVTLAWWLTHAIGDPAYYIAREFTDRHLLKEHRA